MKISLISLSAAFLLAGLVSLSAQEQKASFDGADSLKGWAVEGDVSIDKTRASGDEGASLKVAPGARAVWKLREEDGAGTVTLRVYDDGLARADEKTRGAGPLVGLINGQGRVLTVGAVYAPYLAGNSTYAVSEYSPGKNESPWYGLTYVGERRSQGWHEWSFAFDADTGLKISHNGRVVDRYKYA